MSRTKQINPNFLENFTGPVFAGLELLGFQRVTLSLVNQYLGEDANRPKNRNISKLHSLKNSVFFKEYPDEFFGCVVLETKGARFEKDCYRIDTLVYVGHRSTLKLLSDFSRIQFDPFGGLISKGVVENFHRTSVVHDVDASESADNLRLWSGHIVHVLRSGVLPWLDANCNMAAFSEEVDRLNSHNESLEVGIGINLVEGKTEKALQLLEIGKKGFDKCWPEELKDAVDPRVKQLIRDGFGWYDDYFVNRIMQFSKHEE